METIGEILVFGDYSGNFSVWRLLRKFYVETIGEIIVFGDYWGNFSVWRLLGKF